MYCETRNLLILHGDYEVFAQTGTLLRVKGDTIYNHWTTGVKEDSPRSTGMSDCSIITESMIYAY